MEATVRRHLQVSLVIGLFVPVNLSALQDSLPAPVAACAQVTLDTTSWHRVTASIAPVSFLLPHELHERRGNRFYFSTARGRRPPPNLPVASQFWETSDFLKMIRIERYEWPVDSTPPAWLPDQRAVLVTECSDSVDSHQRWIRSYRAPGMINRNGTELPGYVMEASLQVESNVRFVLFGSYDSPSFQSQVLATIHSLRFVRP